MAPYRVEDCDELVEDSEPEREVIRRAFSHTRDVARLASPVSIIDISDDSFTPPRSGEHELISIIEFTSSSISSPLSISIPVTGANKPSDSDPPSVVRNDVTEGDLPSDDEIPPLGLAKFSFNSHSRGKATISRPSLASTPPLPEHISNSANDPKSTTRKKASGSSHRFSVEFPYQDMARLLRCVACNIHWTVRKTASQKTAHIQSCSKKKGLTEDTVRQLISKEFNAAPLALCQKEKEKASSPEAPPTTILSEIVQEAAPKKRTKRQDVVMTVKCLGETRGAILDRAQRVFAQSSSTFGALHSSDHPSHEEGRMKTIFPSTPEFGSSRLARTAGAKKYMFNSPTSPENQRVSSLPTLGSTLEPGSTLSPHALAKSDASNKAMITATLNKNTSTVTPLVYLSSSSSDTSADSPDPTRDHRSLRLCGPVDVADPSADYAEEQDDVYLHYSPPNATSIWDSHPIPDTTATVASSVNVSGTKPKLTPSKRRRKQAGKGAAPEPLFDDAWEEQIRDNIRADKELHMRILRYEPISFKTFLEYTPTNDVESNGKIKVALKHFLDKQAIHFYDEETMGRRR